MLLLLSNFLPHLEYLHVHLRVLGHLCTLTEILGNFLLSFIGVTAVEQNLISISFLIYQFFSFVVLPLYGAAKL